MQLSVSAPAFDRSEHLGARRLRLHQEGREIGGLRERIGPRAHHLAAGRGDEARRVALQRDAERVVRR